MAAVCLTARSAALGLHQIAAATGGKSYPRGFSVRAYSSALSSALGEVAGILLAAEVFGWSVRRRHDFPLDGAFCFFALNLMAASFGVLSLSLHGGAAWELDPYGTGASGGLARSELRCKRFALFSFFT